MSNFLCSVFFLLAEMESENKVLQFIVVKLLNCTLTLAKNIVLYLFNYNVAK